MSEREGFLSRWARRKRENNAPQSAGAPADPVPTDAATPVPPEAPTAPAPEEPSVDLSALPPIESITATTDIRPFLAPGVPAELTRAALRRAWVADPQIRDFIGIAENQWDFTDPNAIPGFGALGSFDDVRRLLARVIGEADQPAATPQAAASAEPRASSDVPADARSVASGATAGEMLAEGQQYPSQPTTDVQRKESEGAHVAPQKNADPGSESVAPIRRGHGRALPR